MVVCCRLAYKGFVHLNTHTWARGNFHTAMLKREDGWIEQVIEEITMYVVMNIQALFLYEEVMRAGVDV